MLRNKLIYLLLAAYSVVFAILYNRYISALIMMVILCLPFILLIMLFVLSYFVSVDIIPPTHTVGKGEDMELSFRMRNNSFLPITYCKFVLSYGNGFAKKPSRQRIKMFLDSKSELSVTCHIKAEHCGKVTVCCESILLYDYFKLFSVRKKIRKKVDILVMPQLYEIEEEFKPNPNIEYSDSETYSKVKAGDDASEVFRIREYQEGDRIQRIHWKLSSKTNQMMIKEYSLPMNCSISILADFTFNVNSKKLYSNMDALLETIFSISNYLILAGFHHYMVWYDSNKKECQRTLIAEWEDLCMVMEELLCLEIKKDNDSLFEVYKNSYGREQMADMFYIGDTLTDEIINHIEEFHPCIWHVLFLTKKTVNIEVPDVRFLKIDMEKVGESLKEGAF